LLEEEAWHPVQQFAARFDVMADVIVKALYPKIDFLKLEFLTLLISMFFIKIWLSKLLLLFVD